MHCSGTRTDCARRHAVGSLGAFRPRTLVATSHLIECLSRFISRRTLLSPDARARCVRGTSIALVESRIYMQKPAQKKLISR